MTELSISYNAQTSTEQFIHQDTANTELTGYQPSAPVTAQVVKGDAAFEFINGLRKKLPTGGPYPAARQPVSIQIDSYGGAASDPLAIGYTINWRGEGVEGTFNPDTRAFTAGTGV